MEVKDIIKARRQELNLTMKEVANIVGVNEGTISRWESGDIANMKRDKIMALSKALQLSPAVIMEWDDSYSPIPYLDNLSPITKTKFALFDGIAAGEPRYIPDGVELYVESTTKINADYALKVHGDSMIGARIHDGDYVFIRIQPEVENGEIAAVRIGDSATLKRVYFYREKSLLILKAENPEYEDMIYQDSELEDVQILGKAVAFQGDVK